jgi:hypothetical protein
MASPIPPVLQPLLSAYLDGLSPLGTRIQGVYLYGSVALDGFDERRSDIDLVVLTQGIWSAREIAHLKQMHEELSRSHRLGRQLAVSYVPLAALGGTPADRYPVHSDGRLRAEGRGDLNAVTWWMVKHRGLTLLGPAGSGLSFEVPWSDVVSAMRYNLEVYWAQRSEGRHALNFLSDYWVEFAVSTLCRILTTLEDGEIVGKEHALARWRNRLDARWHPLLEDAHRIRSSSAEESPFRSRLARMRETRAFVAYVRERAQPLLRIDA